MRKICTAPPTVLAVDLELIKRNMKIDGDYMDLEVTSWARGVIRKLEHEIGQCIMEQTWEVTLDSFAGQILLPHPVQEVVSIRYLDQAYVEQTLASGDWRVLRSEYQSELVPARRSAWPATCADVCTVTITVKCGYGSTPDKTPATVETFVLAKMVEQFDPKTRTEKDTVQSSFIDGLLDACRTYA